MNYRVSAVIEVKRQTVSDGALLVGGWNDEIEEVVREHSH